MGTTTRFSVPGQRASRARPSSARSQHFLRTNALAAELDASAGVGRNDLVVEIGAGTGRLTDVLSHVARRVSAVELDPRLAPRLHDRWPNVDVVEDDAARLALPSEPFDQPSLRAIALWSRGGSNP